MITIGNYDWNNENIPVPDEYQDNPNVERLKKNNLPIIRNIAELFRCFNLSISSAKKLFYPSCRRTFLYRNYELPKKKGGTRTISVPIPELMAIQRAINSVILSEFKMSSFCTGFKRHVSLVDNAKPHLGANTLLKFDIHDFFGSIKFSQVFKQFIYYGYGKKVSELLTLLCVDSEGKLPQGAPTSPALSNLVSLKMDKRIGEFCSKNELIFTRYADDITISSKKDLDLEEINKIKFVIGKIIEDEGFELNDSKTHYFLKGQNMNVTGVCIDNHNLNPSRKILNEIDNALHYIKEYGVSEHLIKSKLVLDSYNAETYIHRLLGLISYVYMINPKKGERYFKKFNMIPEEKLK